jgi:hypothetical protein
MKAGALIAIGSTFVGLVLGGFLLGLFVAEKTGASWWVIVGTFGGLFAGLGTFAAQIMRSVK